MTHPYRAWKSSQYNILVGWCELTKTTPKCWLSWYLLTFAIQNLRWPHPVKEQTSTDEEPQEQHEKAPWKPRTRWIEGYTSPHKQLQWNKLLFFKPGVRQKKRENCNIKHHLLPTLRLWLQRRHNTNYWLRVEFATRRKFERYRQLDPFKNKKKKGWTIERYQSLTVIAGTDIKTKIISKQWSSGHLETHTPTANTTTMIVVSFGSSEVGSYVLSRSVAENAASFSVNHVGTKFIC